MMLADHVVVGVLAALAALLVTASLFGLLAVVWQAVKVVINREWVPLSYNWNSLRQRSFATWATIGGLALVILGFMAVVMFATGLRDTLVSTGSEMNVKVLREGAQSEMESDLLHEQIKVLSADPGVQVAHDGVPLASSEVVVLIFAHHAGAQVGSGSNLAVRGVGTAGLKVHTIRDLDGRLFAPGSDEIVIGKALEGKYEGAHVGGSMQFARRKWKVVGVADHGGSAFDTEIWGDVTQFEDAFKRRPASLTLTLRTKSDFDKLEHRIASDPQLSSLQLVMEREYWESQARRFVLFVLLLGALVTVLFAIGASLAAMITMSGQVASRSREIGTMRALGFTARSLLVSFTVESALLGLVAGAVAVLIAPALQYVELSTMNWQTNSEVVFNFQLSLEVVVFALVLALMIGAIGGLLPALRAARTPIIEATRGA